MGKLLQRFCFGGFAARSLDSKLKVLIGLVFCMLAWNTCAQESPWGVAPSHTSSARIDTWVDEMKQAGVKSIRGFRSSLHDSLLEKQKRQGFEVTGILQWSSESNPGSFPVDDLAGWENYVQDTVRRYKGKVQSWEVWNEPPNFTHDKRPESYAKILTAAYHAAKNLDPDIQIGMAVKSTDINFLSAVLESGAINQYDFITLHPYEVAGAIEYGYDALFMNIVPALRRMLEARNPEKADVPVRFTEIAIGLKGELPLEEAELRQASNLIKIYTMGIAQEVERINWFEPIDSETLKLGLLTAREKSRKSLLAYAELTGLLGEHPDFLGWFKPTSSSVGFLFKLALNDELALIVWTAPDMPSTMDVDEQTWNVLDFKGGNQAKVGFGSIILSERPLAIQISSDSPNAEKWRKLATSNLGKPFLWDGTDYSDRQEISVSAGQAPEGLHFIRPPTLIATDEGLQFDLSDQPSVSLVIDPTFISAHQATVELEVTLKANDDADHTPGFNVKLASYSGSTVTPLDKSGAGWNSVREYKWQKMTWRIEDFSTSAEYGYQISLNSDSRKYSQFVIREIRLRKLVDLQENN